MSTRQMNDQNWPGYLCMCACVSRICTHAHFTVFDKVYRHLVYLSVSKQSATYMFPRNGSAYEQYLDTFSAVFMIRSGFFSQLILAITQLNTIWLSVVRIESIQLMCVCVRERKRMIVR